ncbi:MAG: hypothetical protein K0S18_1300, partial [Anaerocolumna sp.]|nr:hypothetical protein [Anaerocolumna sp.]
KTGKQLVTTGKVNSSNKKNINNLG